MITDISILYFASGIVILRPCHLNYNNFNNINNTFDQSEMTVLDKKFNLNVSSFT